ncbi:hypothetical protein ACP70R_044794 [Stipagrostis hirtigluma subsp. patula]
MDLTSAVHWWEKSQLRVLVLSSLVIQWILFLSSLKRRRAIPGWFRSIIWLAYLGSDAVAIYALATLFNRHKNQGSRGGGGGGGGSNGVLELEVVWTPILLIHLGGQDTITAYNIEDNELWRRHILTSVCQVTVAIYVFCKSWPGGDKRLLQTAILLFVVGVIKCLEKPLALKRASINSLVSSSQPARKTTNKEGEINSLQDYVQEARALVLQNTPPPPQEEGEIDAGQDKMQEARGTRDDDLPRENKKIGDTAGHGESYKLFVDLASPYPDRLHTLKYFWKLDENNVYPELERKLSDTFELLYTKIKMSPNAYSDEPMWTLVSRTCCICLPFAAIGLFHHSHRQEYNEMDVKITYALICCAAILEGFSNTLVGELGVYFEVAVSQYNLMAFFTRNKRHSKKMFIVSLLGCKDFVDQHWCSKACSSTPSITKLVLQHVKTGWKNYIQDAASYIKFNDYRGQWTLMKCNKSNNEELGWSLKRPFDESILLWHMATDFCFYLSKFQKHQCAFAAEVPTLCSALPKSPASSPPSYQTKPQCGELTYCKAVQCRQMSNYMIYLLFINPEMLLPGSRRNLFTTAYGELQGILKGCKPTVEEIDIIERIKTAVKPTDDSKGEGFINDAWVLAEKLQALGDEKKWEVIQGVWVEMLCFSASRCRGYLHAKALGTGGELLTYVWLLLSCMGMETLTERSQREELPSDGGNTGLASSATGAALLASKVSTGVTSPSSEVHNGTAPSTSKVHKSAAASTSEICNAAGDEMV